MELLQAINERHSVRSYLCKPVGEEKAQALQALIDECNKEGGLHLQLVLNEPKAFDGFMAHYGKFSGVRNYVALVGEKTDGLQEKVGYYGAKIILLAQTLGLNTCWVAMTYKKIKTAFTVGKNEKLCGVIALGYGTTQGVAHKNKPLEEVCSSEISPAPAWFINGVKTALLAPTAMNQQKFNFALTGDGKVKATAKSGFYTKTDLGIVRYFFELGAGEVTVRWANGLGE